MSLRSWLRETLVLDPDLAAVIDGRVYQSGSLRDATLERPFVVYHMGNDTDEALADDSTVHRQYLIIYVHDSYADYMRIDEIIDLIIAAIRNRGSVKEKVLSTRFLEKSQDMTDASFKTIMRYARFQFIMS